MWMHGFGWGWGGMIFGGVLMLLFWVLLIVLIVWAIRAMVRSSGRAAGPPAAGEKTPLDILKERYARGEINREQYDAMRQDLSK